ncbi:hypothetical protein PAPYR_9197 [Paratrimastix pyriformis]|uniref:F-box domain-containing protein n=1 Tax=Paratrimastix pyriformis TaxID=342808 RepID=A0ABQ8U8Z8_9EUKA|nr:hypothetical protein PAPYR_9197 [Paratrimastix pyriformis]
MSGVYYSLPPRAPPVYVQHMRFPAERFVLPPLPSPAILPPGAPRTVTSPLAYPTSTSSPLATPQRSAARSRSVSPQAYRQLFPEASLHTWKSWPRWTRKPTLMEVIPSEVLSAICGFLDPLDVANVSRACRTFFQVAWKSEYVWHQIALRMELSANPKGKSWMTIVRDGRYRFLPRPEVNISQDGKTVTFPNTTSYTVLVHPPVRTGVWRGTSQFESRGRAGDIAIGWSAVPTLPENYLGNDEISIDWNAWSV